MGKQFTYTLSWSQPYGKAIDINHLQNMLIKNQQKLQELQETLFEKEVENTNFREAKEVLSKFRVNK